jgi:hypothetical protein
VSETINRLASFYNRLMAVPNLNWVFEKRHYVHWCFWAIFVDASPIRFILKNFDENFLFLNFKFKLKNILYVYFKMHTFWDFHIKIYSLQIFFLINKKYIYNRRECTECFCETVQCLYNTLKIHCRTQGSGSVFTYAAFPFRFGSGFPRLIMTR